ncbi:MAG: SagB/ThcOx family dehydrogenase [Rhodospirillum sp.]|nr:SagB/ThcOx family dehydrogenase [Rhodospirillum sp.]MCF8488295.1 SagB/ThcOx family dehydrogenase [Rhodospirillum sp.]MCF8502297.1 SagB/ThcOx family dehydrogenase [Rhodospirillum sp.]
MPPPSKADPLFSTRAYHEASKHRVEGYAPSPGFLDWDSQPSPFRRYVGAPVVPLPLVEVLADPPARPTLSALGHMMELALGLTAWKSLGPDRWPLRANPSSGNLHPTEGYLLLWTSGAPDILPAGLYHYAPQDHLLERRAALDPILAAELTAAHPGTWGAFGLSSLVWREEWKYGSRAYRYCQHDLGHALACLRVAAGVVGWRMVLDPRPADTTVAACLGLDRRRDRAGAEAELPDLLALVGSGPDLATPVPWERVARGLMDWAGEADGPTAPRMRWPEVAGVLSVAGKGETPLPPAPGFAPPTVLEPFAPGPALIRRRRSAQRMDGETGMEWTAFERMLSWTLPRRGVAPFDLWPWDPALNLLLFVHAVGKLEPGLYLLDRCSGRAAEFRAACSAPDLAWTAVPGTDLPLFALRAPLDLRRETSKLSCHQGIAGRGAFSLGMVGALGPVLEEEGEWAYRRLHWEAGMIGQVLYLEAEAAGLRGTGIGCFLDDVVHGLLGLETGLDAAWATLYHFTIGMPLEDDRLSTEPAYALLSETQGPANRHFMLGDLHDWIMPRGGLALKRSLAKQGQS